MADARSSLSPNTTARLTGVLASALAGALSRLDQRIDAVGALAWPSGSLAAGLTPFGARSVSTPASLKSELSARLNPAGQSSSEDRLQTCAKNAQASSGLSAGTYALGLGLGGEADTLSVTLPSGSTVGQVYAAVAEAVNGSGLAVGAEVRKNASGLLNGTSALVLTTDAADAGQAVSLTNASGRLASWLGLSAANVKGSAPVQSASLDTTLVTGLAAAKPTRFLSNGYDPEAPTTLAPGTYTLDYLVGPTSAASADGSGAGHRH